jgi:hypothetical protein
MWQRQTAQDRERAALDFLREHGFYARALALAEGDERRLREVVGYIVLTSLRVRGTRARELCELVGIWSSTAWRHPWLQPGRRLRHAVELVRAVQLLDVEDLNFAFAMTGSRLRVIHTTQENGRDESGGFDAVVIVEHARQTAWPPGGDVMTLGDDAVADAWWIVHTLDGWTSAGPDVPAEQEATTALAALSAVADRQLDADWADETERAIDLMDPSLRTDVAEAEHLAFDAPHDIPDAPPRVASLARLIRRSLPGGDSLPQEDPR